jgi:phosphoglucosamine mutase
MGKLFGTDGVRGVAGQVLTAELALRLGQAAGTVFLRETQKKAITVVIGRDSRISGQMLESALAAGLTSVGVNVIKAGLVPTPGVAYLVRRYHAAAGAVISASHNPYQDNGIKFFNHEGRKLSDAQEEGIEALLSTRDAIPEASYGQMGRISDDPEAVEHYKEFLRELIHWQAPGLKAVIDCANGAASALARDLFEGSGMEVVMLADAPDGVNINDHCGSTHTEALQEAVVQNHAQIGLAFDGDADRFQAVDENGNLVDGDHLMAIYALALKEAGALKGDHLVATVMSNMGLKLAMKAAGITFVETKVGDRHVNEMMQKLGANLGGEQSGHIIFSDFNSTGDGSISAIMLLNIINQTGKSLSQLASAMTSLPQVLINVPVSRKDGWQEIEAITAAIDAANAELGDTGRVLVRASGTENLLRVMVEGPKQDQINRLASAIADAVKGAIGA